MINECLIYMYIFFITGISACVAGLLLFKSTCSLYGNSSEPPAAICILPPLSGPAQH